ncbi:cation diffusion facilitator family transporter [Prescottella equi]|uniref:Cation diffusion facilitator family transporter n=2 Tax=Rhodococcus hoagii TaxID=43767 RepID=E9T744_RHOHA|nr:cation diffusion facilitator family transporter [Prescottella equi]EGD21748.1 cation diffusion facilitator family transporter [Prescottella equi ATCC 33707]ERN43713.1 cation efflux system [Prescottella equi NBRC 101255 = C 7]MBM4627974.1 cation diffusion facilitator family transporter [Prescottella equi]NKS29439.1 cation diffusion facilitator family transporter [Prescottella equi]NKS33622.1 cation diffusion facilitator family transporter [Prescottella equi]
MATSPARTGGGESTLTVVVAFAANALIALAKSVAAVITGSASMVAEATHSWADTGNEVLLLVADRRARKAPDHAHPLGFGREAYIWSLFAALGLFAVGAGVSITHGIQELAHPEPASDFGVAYAVLGIAFVLEAISFRQAFKQLRGEAHDAHRDVLEHALLTSDPTVRAVFAEDAAALIGLVIAFAGVLAHQLTGSPIPDAIGSIAVGVLLGVIALVLLDRNRRFLVGEPGTPELRTQAIRKLLTYDEVERVTYLRMEFLGPHQVYLVASVDLVGDYAESRIAHTLRALEDRITGETSAVRRAVLTLSTAEEPDLTV